MTDKQITIFKRNEIIRGADYYSLNAKKCFNAIYYLYQKNREITTQHTQTKLRYSSLREVMNLQKDNNYVEVINNAIEELQATLVKLNNFEIDGKKYKWYSTKFLNDAYVEKDTEISVTLEISTFFKKLMIANIGFTELDLVKYLNKFRTKYAMKIYEYLKSFEGYKYLDVSQSHMLKLLGLEDSKSYSNYANLKQLVERQLTEIANKSDLNQVRLFNSKLLAKKKIFRIQINPKSKKDVVKIKSKTALDNLVTRF